MTKLLPDMTNDEIDKIKAAYNVLAEIGGRCNWEYWLIDEAHQKLGVMLAVLTARELRIEPGNNDGDALWVGVCSNAQLRLAIRHSGR